MTSSRPASSHPPQGRRWLRRLAIGAGILFVSGYILTVAAGYLWLRYGRNFDGVRLRDVASLDLAAVRRGIATRQFVDAKRELEKKNYQAAYVAYTSAVRKDPGNVTGRLEAAGFLRALGGAVLARNLLEEGLVNTPQSTPLIEATFSLFLAEGAHRDALKLLQRQYPQGFAGPNQLTLENYEVLATLAADGPVAAKRLLDKYPELVRHAPAGAVVARVYWDAGDHPAGIAQLTRYLETQTGSYEEYARLARWQLLENSGAAAVATAQKAAVRLPADPRAQVLLIETNALVTFGGRPDPGEVAAYLRANASRPEALLALATLAGNQGWTDLTRVLLEYGVLRQPNLTQLALCHSDALMARARYDEAAPLLGELERQVPETDKAFAVQLRQRQVIAAAALGDVAGTRDYAHRLRLALGDNAAGVDFCRQLFSRMNIAEAVAELTPRVARSAVPATRK